MQRLVSSSSIRQQGSVRAASVKWGSARALLCHWRKRASAHLECRKLREKEIDPIDAREAARRQAALERVKALKFKDAAAAYMAAHRVAWKDEKHAAQWPATLTPIRLSDYR